MFIQAFYNLSLLEENTKHAYLSDFTTDTILHMLVELVNIMPFFYQNVHFQRENSLEATNPQVTEQLPPSPQDPPPSSPESEESQTPPPQPLISPPVLEASKTYPWLLSDRLSVQDTLSSVLFFLSTIVSVSPKTTATNYQHQEEAQPDVSESPSMPQVLLSTSSSSVTEGTSVVSPQRLAFIRQSMATLCGVSICNMAAYQLLDIHPYIYRISLYYHFKQKRELLQYEKEQGVREAIRIWGALSPELDAGLQATIFSKSDSECYDHKLLLLHYILDILAFITHGHNPTLNGLDVTLLQVSFPSSITIIITIFSTYIILNCSQYS